MAMTKARKGQGADNPGHFASVDNSRDSAGQVADLLPTKSQEARIHYCDGGVEGGGSEIWLDDDTGKQHRIGGPAVQEDGGVARGGSEAWFIDGVQFNPTGGPSKQWDGGVKKGGGAEWTNESGQLHRIGAPAVQMYGGFANGGTDEWYENGELHRLDGPAIQYFLPRGPVGVWYKEGKKHRTDGPADIDINDGTEEYWLDGVWYRVKDDWVAAKIEKGYTA